MAYRIYKQLTINNLLDDLTSASNLEAADRSNGSHQKQLLTEYGTAYAGLCQTSPVLGILGIGGR